MRHAFQFQGTVFFGAEALSLVFKVEIHGPVIDQGLAPDDPFFVLDQFVAMDFIESLWEVLQVLILEFSLIVSLRRQKRCTNEKTALHYSTMKHITLIFPDRG